MQGAAQESVQNWGECSRKCAGGGGQKAAKPCWGGAFVFPREAALPWGQLERGTGPRWRARGGRRPYRGGQGAMVRGGNRWTCRGLRCFEGDTRGWELATMERGVSPAPSAEKADWKRALCGGVCVKGLFPRLGEGLNSSQRRCTGDGSCCTGDGSCRRSPSFPFRKGSSLGLAGRVRG